MSLGTNQVFEFDRFRLDSLRRLLFADGQPVSLTSKAFDTLVVLVRNRDRVVEKQELLKTIWPDSFVEESNLAQHISALRKALGDPPGENRFIATVPGRGYRFVAAVTTPADIVEHRTSTELVIEEEVEVDTGPPPAAPRDWLRIALFTLVPAVVLVAAWFGYRARPVTPTLAVLPFQQLAPAEGDDYLSIGLTDAVITRLSNIRRLVVRPTSSVLKYAQHKSDLTIPGHELGVEVVLDGKVQKSGDNIRVTVQLVRASDNTSLWAGTFDTDAKDLFTIEDAISSNVAKALALQLGTSGKQQLGHGNTVNAEAYKLYLQGRASGFRFTPQGLNQAIDYFNRATALDPSFALAYSGLADVSTTASDWILPPRQALSQAEAAARKALAIDDSLAEAHASLAHALMHQWKLPDAGKEFHRALALSPNHEALYFFYSEYLGARGDDEAAIGEMRKAIQIDPGSAALHAFLCWPYTLRGDYPHALAAANDAINLEPEFWVAHTFAGYGLLALQHASEALVEFQKARDLNPASTLNLAGIAAASIAIGKRSDATAILAQLEEMSKSQYVSPMDRASIYAALGDKDQAFRWLDKAYDDQAEMMLFLNRYPPLEPLRTDPRFASLVRRVGVPQ